MNDNKIIDILERIELCGYIDEVDMICVNNVIDPIYEAMNLYAEEKATQMCLELLEYMAKNGVRCSWYEHDVEGIKYYFHYKGKDITKEELFNNFL